MLGGSVGVEEGMLGPGSGSLCWGGGGGRGMQWYLVTSRSCMNLKKSRSMLKAFLFLTPLATHVWLQLAVSKFVLNGFGGKTSFQKGEKRDVRALPSLLPVLEQEPSHPSSPGSPLHSQPEWRGEAGAVQSESRVLEEKQAKEEPAVRPGRVHRDSHVQTRGNLPHPRSPTLMSHFVLPSNGS